MKSHLISRLVSLCAVMTGLHAANLAHADEKATKPASMTQTVQDQYQAKRDLLIRAYKSLNSNLEGGMFPSIYWDRKQIDAPGGVRLDSAQTLNMVYPLKDKFKDTKFAKTVLAGDWKTAKAEAYASSLEKGKRRHLARQILLDCDNGSPNNVPEFSVVLAKLPAGESALARLICDGILKEHQEILKTRQENTGKGNQAKTQPSSKSAKNIHAAQKTKGAER